MPIPTPYFKKDGEFIASFLKYNLDKQADLAFVFSSYEQADSFKKFDYNAKYISIIFGFDIEHKSAVAVSKKWYGLKLLELSYEYVIMIDAESLIIKNINLLKMCENFFKEKILYGNKTNIWNHKISSHCVKYFIKHKNYANINLRLYMWFHNLFIYKTSHLKHFFKLTKIDENLTKLTWYDFEHLIYAYYLILYKNFKLVDLGLISFWGAFETAQFFVVDNYYLTYKPYHGHIATYKYFNCENIFMLIQLDRLAKYEAKNLMGLCEELKVG